jgi:hypothetical protein
LTAESFGIEEGMAEAEIWASLYHRHPCFAEYLADAAKLRFPVSPTGHGDLRGKNQKEPSRPLPEGQAEQPEYGKYGVACDEGWAVASQQTW